MQGELVSRISIKVHSKLPSIETFGFQAMNTESTKQPTSAYLPLRVWPLYVLLIGMLLSRYSVDLIPDGPTYMWMIVAFGLCGCLLIILWWLTFSRARWTERAIGLLLLIAGVFLTVLFIHPSMQGPAVIVLTIPTGLVVFSLAAITTRNILSFKRTVIAVSCAGDRLLDFHNAQVRRSMGKLRGRIRLAMEQNFRRATIRTNRCA